MPELGLKPNSGGLLGLCFSHLTPELTASQDTPLMRGTDCPLPALLGIPEQGWVRDRRGTAISVEPSMSQALPGSPIPKKAECLTTWIFSPGRDGKGELPQGDFKGRWGCSLCSRQRETPSSWLRWGIPLDFTGVKSGTSCFPIVSALKGENSGPGCT